MLTRNGIWHNMIHTNRHPFSNSRLQRTHKLSALPRTLHMTHALTGAERPPSDSLLEVITVNEGHEYHSGIADFLRHRLYWFERACAPLILTHEHTHKTRPLSHARTHARTFRSMFWRVDVKVSSERRNTTYSKLSYKTILVYTDTYKPILMYTDTYRAWH